MPDHIRASVPPLNRPAVVMGRLLRAVPYLRSHTSYVVRHPRVDGVAVPVMGGRGLRHFWRFEDETFAILATMIDLSPGVFVDIGANIGQTLIKAKSVDASLEYIGFEPSPASYSYTDELIQLNHFENCTLFPVGASDERTVVDLYFAHATDAAATMVSGFWTGKNKKPFRRRILVEPAELLIRQVTRNKVGVIKIDIEGGELEALKGLSTILREDVPPVVMEVLPASCDLDPSFPDTAAGVQLRLERISKLTLLLKDLELIPFRLMPEGVLQKVESFDSEKYVPELTNYLMYPSRSGLSLDEISSKFRDRMTASSV